MDNLSIIKATTLATALFVISGVTEAKEESKTIIISACDHEKINEQLPDNRRIELLWSCNKKDQAIELAQHGAKSGSATEINRYLRVLAANNNPSPGLAYAIKGAESGDTESARWVMRISEIHNIESLDHKIGQWLLKPITDPNIYAYPILDEYIRYAISHSSKENYVPISYSLAFFSLSRPRLDEREIKNLSPLMEKLKKISNDLDIKSKADGEVGHIINLVKKSEKQLPHE